MTLHTHHECLCADELWLHPGFLAYHAAPLLHTHLCHALHIKQMTGGRVHRLQLILLQQTQQGRAISQLKVLAGPRYSRMSKQKLERVRQNSPQC